MQFRAGGEAVDVEINMVHLLLSGDLIDVREPDIGRVVSGEKTGDPPLAPRFAQTNRLPDGRAQIGGQAAEIRIYGAALEDRIMFQRFPQRGVRFEIEVIEDAIHLPVEHILQASFFLLGMEPGGGDQ
ncbi:hypothetical protein SDC9_192158 [bioreactor metagenome]|uniref:Uncharacterized protein n=1 Tax=bioreactor metagenome TaxID=1076179 RepID=A0A645IAZ6_9ZZZZ